MKNARRWLFKRWPVLAVLGALVVLGGWYVQHRLQTRSAQPLAKPTFTYACPAGMNPAGILCLEKTYQGLTVSKGVKAAFAQLKSKYQTDATVRGDCHVLAHVIGRTEADKITNVDAAYAQGDNFCWSGYYHGVMESIVKRIGAGNLDAHIPTICAELKQKKPYSFEHYNCVHGLGHGIMAVKNSQLFDSLKSCDSLSDSWEQESCYGGVFMENEMDEVNPDHSTAFLKNDEPMYPCTAVDDKYKGQCYLMQTSHALRLAGSDFAKVFNECGAVEAPYATVCYQSLGRDISGDSTSNAEQTKADCMLGQNSEAQSNCIIGAVKDFVSFYHGTDQASRLCSSLDAALQQICQSTKTQYFKTF